MSGWSSPERAVAAMAAGTGAGVRVAVLDSGIEISHPEFAGKTLRDDCAVAEDGTLSALGGEGADAYGHGTAVAGMIWKTAPAAEIGSFRVLSAKLSARTAAVALAAERAIGLGYHILNCSFACGFAAHLPIYKQWLDRAYLAGVHVVAASDSTLQPEWPAHFPHVIGVSSAGRGEPGALLQGGPGLIEFSSPTENSLLPWKGGGCRTLTGSSFAAARVSGLVARILSAEASPDALQMKALLRQIAIRAA
ncbi:MAG: S8 family serine peptidase [Terrimicrobiaceae bacterium]|jgi:subtilisin|nr:S8 family serine peptidase [Terrimicrobiaceae bacterium]